VILLGEHAVVYGVPALVVGIDRGAHAIARSIDTAPSTLQLGGQTVFADAASENDIARAFSALLGEGAGVGPVSVEATTDLPPGGGLGCSAALGVAIGRAVEALGAGAPEHAVLRAIAWEKIFHGNPSGIDTAAASRGGCLRFSRSAGVRAVPPAVDLWICVGSTGISSSTRVMVEGLARLRARKPEMVDQSIGAIGALVENAALAITAGDLTGLGQLLDLNQILLSGLMLSTELIEQMCTAARSAGALGVKLTGAGGGGSVIALVPSSRTGHVHVDEAEVRLAADRILDAWRAAGFDGFLCRVETSPPSRSPS
jgi:mevalonate kinase